MYKLVIVDDKDDVIQGIRGLGRWADYGVAIAGWAGNGVDALQVVAERQPEIVLTDIKMPLMDGIKLTEILKEQNPAIKIIILSGYDEFSYAQQAVKLGAEEYLLKPVRLRQLEEVIGRVTQKLDRERSRREEEAELLRRLEQSLPLLRDKFWQRLIEEPDALSDTELQRKLEFLQAAPPPEPAVAVLLEIDQYAGMVDRVSYQQVERLRSVVAGRTDPDLPAGTVFADSRERLVWVAPGAEDGQFRLGLLRRLERIGAEVREEFGFTVSMGISRSHRGGERLFRSYREAREALAHKLHLGPDQIIFHDDVAPEPPSAALYPLQLEKELLAAVRLGDAGELRAGRERYFANLRQSAAVAPQYVKQCLAGLALSLSRLAGELRLEERSLTPDGADLLTAAVRFETLAGFEEWLTAVCQRIAELIQGERKLKSQSKMEQAREYIADHLAEEISLNSVAEQMGLSPNYFSSLFKEHTGETFMEYLVKTRLEKAKELLRSGGYKVYEVANRVGYSDPRYFSEIFKKYVGVNPAEYSKT
jgi:two-component system response regulator YesN